MKSYNIYPHLGSKVDPIVQVLIEELVSGGKWKPLHRFMSVTAIARKFNVCRQTANLAMDQLKAMHLVYSQRGSGTYVCEKAPDAAEIGVIFSSCRFSEIFGVFTDSLKKSAAEKKINLQFFDISYASPRLKVEKLFESVQKCIEKGVRGVIWHPIEFVPEAESVNRQILDKLRAAGLPVVVIDSHPLPHGKRGGYDFVGMNNLEAGCVIADQLIESGRRSLRFVSYPYHGQAIAARITAFLSEPNYSHQHVWLVDPTDDADLVRRISSDPDVDALICHNDILAVRVQAILRRLNREEIQVVGFDGVSYAKFADPPFLTIRQPCDAIAAHALDRILRRISHPSEPFDEILFEPSLIS